MRTIGKIIIWLLVLSLSFCTFDLDTTDGIKIDNLEFPVIEGIIDFFKGGSNNPNTPTVARAKYTTIPNDVEVWILFGREITKYAYPVYEAPVGYVQFEVVVDKEGNVIKADKYSVNKSSVPMDYIKACQAAAKHLKFEPADKASIITVSFSVKNK